MINGNQGTILWHVDDLKISHVEPKAVTGVIQQLEEAFKDEAPLMVTRRNVQDYLGMTLGFSLPGKTKIIMVDYIDTMLKDMPSEFDGEAATPATNHLFEVSADPAMIDEDKATMCHHNVATKLLFPCKRARPDAQTAVAFLCTRVKGLDTDNYKKLSEQ
jgi:hypothetical protein